MEEYNDDEVYTDYAEAGRCDECGGQMTWCALCQMWSRTCCDDYGTCMCS